MTKSLSLVMLLLSIGSGCALSDQPEPETSSGAQAEISGAQAAIIASAPVPSLESTGDRELKKTASLTITVEEVRRAQTLLKTAGFDPGRIDGAFGPKTKFALVRLRSGCVGLNDLLQGAELDKLAPSPEVSISNRNDAARTTVRKEEIRLIQVRLKDAGFDPGPVDGIAGAKTRAAVERFRSACRTLKNLPPAVVQLAGFTEQSNFSAITIAADAGTAERAGASKSTGSAPKASTNAGIRPVQNRPKDTGAARSLLDGYANAKTKSAASVQY